jgi:xanthine dehydrogenase molybdopterin binding subunit/xanthine dehydrogenase small subunit
MAAGIEFTLNGRLIRVADASPNLTLLDYLRGNSLTGSKEGCAEGDCGACSVVMLERDSQGKPAFRAINSCLVPLCLMAGRELVSVEGVAGPAGQHPVQEKMVACHGSQCGYCTPGFILSLFEGYYRGDIRTADQLDDQLCGNLCRCTGYRSIRDAAVRAFQQRHRENGHDKFAEHLRRPVPALNEVLHEANGERFLRPSSLADLLTALSQFPDARLIAGATELGLDITKRFKRFPTLISVEAVPDLKLIQVTPSEWRIGAAASLTHIEEQMAGEFPALGSMLRVFGSRQIRNRATMGGNIVTASPIGDSAPWLLALDARVVLASLQPASGGSAQGRNRGSPATVRERILPIEDFFVAYRKTALEPGEILKTILVPRGPSKAGLRRHCRWYKVSRRREMDISTVAGCFALDLDSEGLIRNARLAYGGVAAMPARARKAEQALIGEPVNEHTLEGLLPVLDAEFTPISDVRGSAGYRQELISSLCARFFHEIVEGESKGDLPKSPRLVPEIQTTKAPPHESARHHVNGAAMYTDDLAMSKPGLEVWPVCSPHAKARILKRDASAARSLPGVRAVLMAEDIPGSNDVGTKHDEVLFADKEVSYHSQIVALVVGDSLEACRAAAEKVVVDYEPRPAVLTLQQALVARSFHNEPNYIRRGNIEQALARSPLTLSGTFELGGQDHFYLESHAAAAEPGEAGTMLVVSSTQHPSEVQAVVAHVLREPINKVVVQCPRMGGGFGGKETQAALPASLAALAARQTGRRVRVRFNRDQDMMITGHRHPFLARFEVGFDQRGRLRAARIHLWSDGGWALDLSQAVTDRALFHLDNAYYLPAVEFSGQVAKTNLSSNTAFRGFGGPQGMLVIEEIIDRVARRLGLDPETVRTRNLYRGRAATNTTHYGQQIGDQRIPAIWRELLKSSRFLSRRKLLRLWNGKHSHRKRGLAITPVKFGISFTVTHLNQAGALVLIYQDGTIQVNHGGTEMGQGIHTNIASLAAAELGVSPGAVRVMPTSTDKVPNTSATAASCGTDLNGAAVVHACGILRQRLAPVAAALLKPRLRKAPGKITFSNGFVYSLKKPAVKIPFAEVVRKAYLERISLSANGYYATPGIHWDRVAGQGKPFHYFACGAAVAEVEVDGFTGMHRVLRVDILHDVGNSINAGVNRGQVEGGFIQGMGWLTTEELKWDDQGRLLTHSPDTYKIPAAGDTPAEFRVTLLRNSVQPGVVHGSKAVGEPPLMLAISVREAIRDAVAAFGPAEGEVTLASPATAEAIFRAISQRRKKLSQPRGWVRAPAKAP